MANNHAMAMIKIGLIPAFFMLKLFWFNQDINQIAKNSDSDNK